MEKIQKVITEIHQKVGRLKDSLNRVETENETLKDELNMLNEKLTKTERQAEDFRQKYDEVKDQLQRSEIAVSTDDKDEKIDLLVREIDDCISRLKA